MSAPHSGLTSSPSHVADGAVLHLLMTADPGALQQCRRLCRPGDQLVIAGSAVSTMMREVRTRDHVFECDIKILGTDAVALGFEQSAREADLELIGDADFVALTQTYAKILTWT